MAGWGEGVGLEMERDLVRAGECERMREGYI